jgi:hypothetical protein
MLFAFVLLVLAICATWAESLSIGTRQVKPWLLLFSAAVLTGWLTGLLQWQAVVLLILLVYCAWRAGQEKAGRTQRWGFGIVTALLTLGLAAHRFAGFNNPILIADAVLTPDAAAFTQYANFDKGAAGAILLACLCRHSRSREEWRQSINTTLAIGIVTVVVVIGVAWMLGHVRPAPKLPAYTPVFLLVNLFFTCVAEEAFFRGFIQERLARALAGQRGGAYLAVAVSALLFGLAHAGGGAVMVVLATLAGLGYAFAYAKAGTIEAPIMVHFALNAVHFIGFTYPYLR